MKAVSIIIVGSSAIASSTSSDVNINVNNKSNPHHYKKRYDNGRRGLSSAKAGKNGKGSKGSNSKGTKASVVMPTPAPDLDDENDLDDETTNPTSVPTSTPSKAPSSAPIVPCRLTCTGDSFTIETDSTSDTPYYFGNGVLPEDGIYSDNFLENDVVCGDDTLVLRSTSGGDGFTFTTDSLYPNTILMLFPPCSGQHSVVYEACVSVDGEETEDCCTATMTVDVKPCAAYAPCQDGQVEGDTCEFDGQVCTCESVGGSLSYGETCIPAECAGGCTEGCSCPFEDATCNDGQGCFCNGELVWVGTCPGPVGIEKKGKSEGIGFDPRAFELDEEEDLDFLMSMSMPMRVVDTDADEDDVEKEEVVEEIEESATADDNLDAAKSFWGW